VFLVYGRGYGEGAAEEGGDVGRSGCGVECVDGAGDLGVGYFVHGRAAVEQPYPPGGVTGSIDDAGVAWIIGRVEVVPRGLADGPGPVVEGVGGLDLREGPVELMNVAVRDIAG
jgi:hypothetical protein